MKSPYTGKEMRLLSERVKETFRKEEFEIIRRFYHCDDTLERFVTAELGDLALTQLLNAYREKHRIPFPEEIRVLRETYGLPASKMATILGFGANMYGQYEAGEVPSESNGKLIRLASDPRQFLILLQSSDVKEKERIRQKIQTLIQKADNEKRYSLADLVFEDLTPTLYNGYKTPDFEKAVHAVLFFSEKLQPFKTKLNKLLFYADFGHYKRQGISITGLSYRAIPYGLVPSKYDILFSLAESFQYIRINRKELENGIEGSQFIAGRTFDASLFRESELEVLKDVVRDFSRIDTGSLIEKNHHETAWKEHVDTHALVSYQYSFEMLYF